MAKKLSDKTLATRMLQARERGGYRFLPFIRMNAKGYSILIIYFAAVLAGLAFAELWVVFYVILGLVFGVFLRDISWLIGVQRTWPFVTKITDWATVERLAGESS
jgi:hypothetical protein